MRDGQPPADRPDSALNPQAPVLDYLVVGHVTKDVVPEGFVLGGTVTFASLTARNLGRRAAVLTRSAPLTGLAGDLQGIPLHVVPAAETTTFENFYTPTRR